MAHSITALSPPLPPPLQPFRRRRRRRRGGSTTLCFVVLSTEFRSITDHACAILVATARSRSTRGHQQADY